MKYNVQNLAFLSTVIAFASCQQHKEVTIDESGNEVIKVRKPTEETIVDNVQPNESEITVPLKTEKPTQQSAPVTKPTETPKSTDAGTINTGKPAPSITVKGIVKDINKGKDGYTARIETSAGQVVAATISRSNLKDPKQYRDLAIGDVVTVTGNTWKLDGVNQMTVRVME
jgi:hypothetical protein